jgi:hypothetical protein
VDLELLEILMNQNRANSCKFNLFLNTKNHSLENVSITNSPTPVHAPTTRGGVYFSDKFAYKIKGTISDLSIIPLLTKTMLGPNTEFGEIKIIASIIYNDKQKDISIYANLINSVQGPSKIDLNMIIIKLDFN